MSGTSPGLWQIVWNQSGASPEAYHTFVIRTSLDPDQTSSGGISQSGSRPVPEAYHSLSSGGISQSGTRLGTLVVVQNRSGTSPESLAVVHNQSGTSPERAETLILMAKGGHGFFPESTGDGE